MYVALEMLFYLIIGPYGYSFLLQTFKHVKFL